MHLFRQGTARLSPDQEDHVSLTPEPRPQAASFTVSRQHLLSGYLDVSEAISIEKRYFTSDLSSLS